MAQLLQMLLVKVTVGQPDCEEVTAPVVAWEVVVLAVVLLVIVADASASAKIGLLSDSSDERLKRYLAQGIKHLQDGYSRQHGKGR